MVADFLNAYLGQARWPRRSFLRGKQASAPVVNGYWKPRVPGQIDSTLVVADELKGGVMELEGEQLVSVPLGHTDTDNTTCLHARSIGLVVAGDSAYNDVRHRGTVHSSKSASPDAGRCVNHSQCFRRRQQRSLRE